MKKAGYLLYTTILTMTGLVVPASANTTIGVFEEIIVTSQKREQNLQDVGVSVTAFSGEQLEKLGYTATHEIAQQTPGLNISSFHATLANVNIRGISQNDFADHLEPPVAMYVDEAYVSSMGIAISQMFDVERVEVLRGPQGTLFGRNATGGLIHYISRKPTKELEGYARLTVGRFDMIQFEGAISGPISETVSARLAISTNHDDGYMRNRIGKNLHDNGIVAVRGQVQFHPSEDFTFLLKGSYSQDDTKGGTFTHYPSVYGADGLGYPVGPNENPYGTCNGCDAFGWKDTDTSPWIESIGGYGQGQEEPFFDREIIGITATATWQADSITLSSITDYLSMDKSFSENADASPFFNSSWGSDQDFKQFSQELRINGTHGKLSWVGGLYYLHINTDVSVRPTVNMTPFLDPSIDLTLQDPAVFAPFIFTPFPQATFKTKSWAIFGHVEYEITPEWRLIGALRYTEDTRRIKDHLLQDANPANPLGMPILSFTDLFPDSSRQRFNNVSAKAQIDWTPIDDLLIYASYSRGHKAGNFSLPLTAFSPDELAGMPHDEEVLISYEAGFKTTLFGGIGRLNASVFYYDYKDYQASFFVNLAQTIGNVDARVYGGEAELMLRPAQGLDILFGVSVLDAKAKDIQRSTALPPQDMDLPYSPKYSLNGLVRYEWPLFTGNMAVQGDFNYVDKFCFTVICHPTEEESGYFVANTRISYTSGDDRWSIAAFVRNIANKKYRVYAVDTSFLTTSSQLYAPPRWYGLTLSYNL